MANPEGVWRTIGGRRIFIKTGQSVSSAMKESGKFKKATKTTKEDLKGANREEQKKINENYIKEQSKLANEKESRQELTKEYKKYSDSTGSMSDDAFTEKARALGMSDEEIAKQIYAKHDGPESNTSSDNNIKRLLAKQKKEEALAKGDKTTADRFERYEKEFENRTSQSSNTELKEKMDQLRKDRKGLVYNLEEGYMKDLSNEEKLKKVNAELENIKKQNDNIKKIDEEAMAYQKEKHGEKGVEEYKKYMNQGDDTFKKATGESSKTKESSKNIVDEVNESNREYAKKKAEEYRNTKDPMFQDVKEARARDYEKQASYKASDLEEGKPYEIDMGNGIKKTAIYLGKDTDGNSAFYDGEGVNGTFAFSDKFVNEKLTVSDNKDDDKFMDLHNQLRNRDSNREHKTKINSAMDVPTRIRENSDIAEQIIIDDEWNDIHTSYYGGNNAEIVNERTGKRVKITPYDNKETLSKKIEDSYKENKTSSNDWVRDAFNQYKKDHPNTKMTIADFKRNNLK